MKSRELRATGFEQTGRSKLAARSSQQLSCETSFYWRGQTRRNVEKSVIPVLPDLVYKMILVPELKVLLSRDQIAKRVTEMAEEITHDFKGQSVIFVGVLKGAAIFLSDLARQVSLDATFDFIGVSSYGNRPIAADDPAGHAAWDSVKCA